VAVGFLHHVDHVLRADHSGWPFTGEVTPFTFSLLAYPVVLAVLALRSRPLFGAVVLALMLAFTQFSHVFTETPADQYGTWAENASSDHAAPGQPNLLGVRSPLLGLLSAANSILLSVVMLAAAVSFFLDSRRTRTAAGARAG